MPKTMSQTQARSAIHPKRSENYASWYQAVIKAADLAEPSSVRGCMVIKPWGYAIWEKIQQKLDKELKKKLNLKNYSFPLFIPLSFIEKEASQVKGFAKECAVVTHHRLKKNANHVLVPSGKLEEPLIIRPTSETVIGEAYSRWIQSYRDLPMLGNQWVNVVRWEMRTRLFLRTSEFLWQEAHTAHATTEEAENMSKQALVIYQSFAENCLAMPVIAGKKTQREKFPGAETTYTIEAMMQDKKALQAGTSHFLGQNFSKAFAIKFLSKAGKESFVWTTSFGMSTRLIGGLIMTHSDDDGLILPPSISPQQVIIIPLIHNKKDAATILAYCDQIATRLRKETYEGQPIEVKIDEQEKRPGDKIWGWIKKGVPIRLEIGIRELETKTVSVARRDQSPQDKSSQSYEEVIKTTATTLKAIQHNLFERAKHFQEKHTQTAKSKSEFIEIFSQSTSTPGFVIAPWIDDPETEDFLKKNFQVTPRCCPLNLFEKNQTCLFTKQKGGIMTLFAKAY